MPVKYAEPRYIDQLDQCWFYHVMDLPEVGTVNQFGSWDLRGRFGDYINETDLRGKTFLDIGSASGFLSFEAEKRGAIVTSFDVAIGDQVNIDAKTDAEAKRNEVVMMQNGYWFAHRLLQSKARVVYGDASEVSKLVEPSDIVMLGQILVHMRDPILVLEQAAKLAKQTLIIAEGSFASDQPTATFYGTRYPGTNSWWHLSNKLYDECLRSYGFEKISVTISTYRCNHPAAAGMSEIWTYVAHRN
jgi:hypothetical protein